MPVRLSCAVNTATKYKSHDEIQVTFQLRNDGDEGAHVLKWYTPLEGLFSDCLEVRRDGQKVDYDGPLAKRGKPGPDDYVFISPGEAVQAVVSLASAYQVSEPGRYEVRATVVVNDVIPATRSTRVELAALDARPTVLIGLESAPTTFVVEKGENRRMTLGEEARLRVTLAKFSAIPPGLQAALVPGFVGGDQEARDAVLASHNAALNLAQNSLTSLANDAHYTEWFGAFTDAREAKAKDTYNKVVNGLTTKTLTYNLTGNGCQASWYAYTHKGDDTVWMCAQYWDAPPEGTDSKAGTVVHELTHAMAGTDDLGYGQQKARALAAKNPDNALQNADNYEYFAGG
jgi:peptidyl-Lys metalloendopeptidase